MLFEDFVEQVSFIELKEREAIKNQLTAACLISWQQGAGGKKTFGEYLEGFGLSEKKKKLTTVQKKKLASRGVHIAQKILRMKSRRKKSGKNTI